MRGNCDGEDFCLPMTVALALLIGSAGQRKAMAGRCDGEDHGAVGVGLRPRDGERARFIDREGKPKGNNIGLLKASVMERGGGCSGC